MTKDQENITQLHPTQREFAIAAYEFGDGGVVTKVEISNDEFQMDHILMTVVSDPKFNPDDWMLRVAVPPEDRNKIDWYMQHMGLTAIEELIGHAVIVNSMGGGLEFAFLDPRWVDDELAALKDGNA